MTAFSEMYQTIPGILILLAAMLLVLGQFRILLHAAQKPRKLSLVLLAAVHLTLNFTLLFLLLYGIDEADHSVFDPAPLRQDFSRVAQAIEQCAANTVRHADGDTLSVTLTETSAHCTAAFRNNGNPPAHPVAETGGLLYLRRAAEEAGGTMTVRSEPVFLLTISLPKN